MKKIALLLITFINYSHLNAVSDSLKRDLRESISILDKLLENPNFFEIPKTRKVLSVDGLENFLMRVNAKIKAENALDRAGQESASIVTRVLISKLRNDGKENEWGITRSAVELSLLYENIK